MGGRGYPHTFYLFRCYISRIPVLSPEFCQFRQYLQVFSTFKGENKIVTKSAPNMVQFQKKKKKKKVSENLDVLLVSVSVLVPIGPFELGLLWVWDCDLKLDL